MKLKSILNTGILVFSLSVAPMQISVDSGSLNLAMTKAYAGQGNDNGGGNGNGNGNAGGNGNGNAGGPSANSKSARSRGTNPQGKEVGRARAEFAKEFSSLFGGLNAFRASRTAFANASKDSRVGKISAYNKARSVLDDAKLTLEKLTLQSEIDALKGKLIGLQKTVDTTFAKATNKEYSAADKAAVMAELDRQLDLESP